MSDAVFRNGQDVHLAQVGGEVESSETIVRLDPRPPHSEIFNSGDEILPPEAVFEPRSLTAENKELIKTVTYAQGHSKKPARSGILEPFIPVDLFGDKIVQTPPAPAMSVDPCAECGSKFEREHRMGRPVRFCGDKCRRTHAARQRREWNSSPLPPIISSCRRCGQPLEIRQSGPGRARQYCSRRCLLGADNHGEEAGSLFDLAVDQRKPK